MYEANDLGGPLNLAINPDPELLRVRRWVSTTRASMLINGNALGDRHINVWPSHRPLGSFLVIFHCDDSWNPDTGAHDHHEETEQDYDQGP